MAGLRRALALLILGFYVHQFLITALLGPDELLACYAALSACYAVAFVGLAAEWFWARWFAMGIGNFGTLFLLVLLSVGYEPLFLILGLSHLAVIVLLLGEGMASRYEHSEFTQEKWRFHEDTLVLMRRAVKSAGSTLPLLILYTLAPRPDALQYAALGLAVAGLALLARARTAGLLAFGAAGGLALLDALGLFGAPPVGYLVLSPDALPFSSLAGDLHTVAVYGPVAATLAACALLVPLCFARPMLRFVRSARG